VNILFSVGFFYFHVQVRAAGAATELKKSLAGVWQSGAFQPGRWRHPNALFCYSSGEWRSGRTFAGFIKYHGAEHKTVFAFESGDPLSLPRAKISHLPPTMRHQLPHDGDAVPLWFTLVPVATFFGLALEFALPFCQ